MENLLRFDGSLERDPAIDTWLDAWAELGAAELGEIARRWFSRMRACGHDVRELMHDGCPVACVDDVPFGYVNVFKSHVNVGFFLGAELPDPAGLLQGRGRRMRHVKIRPDSEPDAAALEALIAGAYADVRRRIAN